MHFRGPANCDIEDAKDPGFGAIVAGPRSNLCFGSPDCTKNAPFAIISPSDLHTQFFHMLSDVYSLFVTYILKN